MPCSGNTPLAPAVTQLAGALSDRRQTYTHRATRQVYSSSAATYARVRGKELAVLAAAKARDNATTDAADTVTVKLTREERKQAARAQLLADLDAFTNAPLKYSVDELYEDLLAESIWDCGAP